MGIFKDRSNFFKTLASNHKLIAHGRDEAGITRKSFHRMNDEEMQSALQSLAHFPCLIHFDYAGRYSGDTNAIPKRQLRNEILILQKAGPADMSAIEDAYDLAFTVMEDLVSWMYNEYLTKGYCGPFSSLDLGRFSFSPIDLNGNLFGWSLSFEDGVYADYVTNFDSSKWFDQ